MKTLTSTTYFKGAVNHILKSFPVRFCVNRDLANQNLVDLLQYAYRRESAEKYIN